MTINILRKTYKSNNNSNTVKSVNNVRNIKNMNIRNKTHKRVYNKHKYVKKSLVGGSYNRITSTDTDIDSFHKKMFAYIDSGSITHVSLETFNTDITIQKATFTNNIILYAFLILYFIKEYTFKIDISKQSNIDILTKIIKDVILVKLKNYVSNINTTQTQRVYNNNENFIFDDIKNKIEDNTTNMSDAKKQFIFRFLQQYFTKSNIQDISAYLEIINTVTIIDSIIIHNTPTPKTQVSARPPLTLTSTSTSTLRPPLTSQPQRPPQPSQLVLPTIIHQTRQNLNFVGVGILNSSGQSCFMNACLQLLWDIDILRKYFITISDAEIQKLDGLLKQNYRTKHVDGTTTINQKFKNDHAEIKEICNQFLPKNTNDNDNELNAKRLYMRALKQIFTIYNKAQQNNTIGYINLNETLVDGIPADKLLYDFVYRTDKNCTYGKQCDATEMMRVLQFFDYFITNQQIYEVYKQINVISHETSTCVDKNKITNVHDKHIILFTTSELPINSSSTNIEELIKSYTTHDTLDADNTCSVHNAIFSKTINIIPLQCTKYIIFTLNRFSFDKKHKSSHKILIPITLNDKITFTNNANIQVNYVLCGCVVHIGSSPHGGHYVYYRYNNDGTRPSVCFDDTKVININNYTSDLRNGSNTMENEILQNAYIILYTRK